MSDLTLDEALALDASGTIRPEAKIALSPSDATSSAWPGPYRRTGRSRP